MSLVKGGSDMTLILCTGTSMSDDEWVNWSEVVKCNFRDCNARTGLAGNGRCFNRGDWTDADCPQFTDEATWLEEWRKSEVSENE